MPETNEMQKLHKLIEQDEQALALLREKEEEIVDHVAPQGFRAASSRLKTMSEWQTIDERLRKNRQRLADLER